MSTQSQVGVGDGERMCQHRDEVSWIGIMDWGKR